MEHHCPDGEELDGLYAAAFVGEIGRLVNEISLRVTAGQHLATIGSLEVVQARVRDLETIIGRALRSELRVAANDDISPFDEL